MMAFGSVRRELVAALVVGMLLLSGHHLSGGATGPSSTALKAQMKVLEAVINETMGQTFAPPFGLLEKAKGTYLPNFGVVFSLEVNLYPVRIPNPFDLRPLSKEELEKARKVKLERIRTIKQAVPRLLADHGSTLREIGADESIAVVVHLFHFQAEGESLPTQIVMEVKKSDLDQYWDKKLSFDGLREKVKTLEL
jgi:hypothetical protein